MREELKHKVDQAVKLIKLAAKDDVIEVAYSGGKDSDVILELTKMAGIKYRAIYKNTTIDPPGTVKHAKDMGAEILMPKNGMTFFKIVEKAGFPNRFRRFCCQKLKEYKTMDKVIIGVRKVESAKRAKRYKEPTQCRIYKNGEKSEMILPVLDWTDRDVEEFIADREIKCAPVYYDENGNFDVKRRLGCMCCPLANRKQRVAEFMQYPKMVRAYLRSGRMFLENHPDARIAKTYKDVYEYFVRDLFYDSQEAFRMSKQSMFGDQIDYKKFLEDYFKVDLS